tara:strand:+ start:316 stop:1299 length:984 start_codon:yes stop_codon:yes gene_type:complete
MAYTFKTRAFGPNAKGDTLSFEELDDSLLFLSESIANNLTSSINRGKNFILVDSDNSPELNALNLSSSYVEAKSLSPSINNRVSVLITPGKYSFSSEFKVDTQYIDLVSLTGDCDVFITGSNTLNVTANDVYLRGIDVYTKNFTIGDNLNSLKMKSCKGGANSFGGATDPIIGATASIGTLVTGKFIDCEGGDNSFGGNGLAYGTFLDCIGGDGSFGFDCNGTFENCTGGNWSFAGEHNIEGGSFKNCTGKENSFASIGDIKVGSTLEDCTGEKDSFASSPTSNIEGNLIKCILTSGSFSEVNIINSGSFTLCINEENKVQTTNTTT